VGTTANISQFINGTAAGLTCFISPNTEFIGWPYGDGGINAAPTSTTSGGGESSSSTPATPSSSGNGNGGDSGSGAGSTAGLSLGGILAPALVLALSSVLGFEFIL
jgi:hypothetical protein